MKNRTRRGALMALFLLGSTGFFQAAWAGGADPRVALALLLGKKDLSTADWGVVLDEHALAGFESEFYLRRYPFNLVADYRVSDDSAVLGLGVEADTREISLGVRKRWPREASWWGAHLSAGPAWVEGRLQTARLNFSGATINSVTVEDKDAAPGVWLGSGAEVYIAKTVFLGLDLRYSYAKVKLFGTAAKAGGTSYAVKTGVRF